MKYPYFRGLEADRYSFYRVPKALIKVDLFEKMSGDAKLLYAVLLDRMNLSLKNGWQDEDGNAYIICTIDEIMDSIRCARQKAVKLLDELEHEYQLIERRRQGLGKPNLLYVKDLYAGLSQSNYWKYENQTSGGLKSELPGVWKSNGSNCKIQGEKRRMMKEKKLSQIILKLHDRAEAAKYDGDSSPPYQEVEMLNFHDEESVVHTVLEDFYAVGTLADELTHGFHMEERGYIDRTEVNSRLIAFARELERILDKWETHAVLIA